MHLLIMMSSPNNPPKILFVDDEDNVLKALKRLFVDENVEVLTASSGKEGLEILKNNEVAVIVSDQRMPEMTGAEFLEKSIKISPDSIRIVLTGYADIETAMYAINKGGASRYITKPWSDTELLITVLNAVETYNLKKENKQLTALVKKQNEELKKWNAELEIYVQQHTIDLTRQNKELMKLNEKLKKNFKDFISAIFRIIELQNRVIYTHSNNVAMIVSDMVNNLSLSNDERETIVIAAQLHDIGKIGTKDPLILKSMAEMTPEEKEEYIKHPLIGQSALDVVEDLRQVGILIRHHHEWYNGDGFPDRLKFDKIPLGSRVIAIADKFDRLSQNCNSEDCINATLKKIKNLSGSQFDPDLYEHLYNAVKSVIKLGESQDVEIEIKPVDLIEGMVVSRDVRSGTGLLLLKKGAVIDEKSIEILKRGYHLDPAKAGIFVYAKRKKP
ncbi:MAG: response regulator [Thermodesulfovibrionales bacterium]|nr:response regulator [Thermodesulfovibrionales bacterium]